MQISECCGSIPWNDTHTCFECGKYAKFINHIKYNTQILRKTAMNERILKLIQKRLEIGQKKYGHENVENDGRCCGVCNIIVISARLTEFIHRGK